MATVESKMITIPFEGSITAKGGMYGPITSPYKETVGVIGEMLFRDVPVIEHLNNGRELKLDFHNFENDNNIEEEVVVVEEFKVPDQINVELPLGSNPASGETNVPPAVTTETVQEPAADVVVPTVTPEVTPAVTETPVVTPEGDSAVTETSDTKAQTQQVNNKGNNAGRRS